MDPKAQDELGQPILTLPMVVGSIRLAVRVRHVEKQIVLYSSLVSLKTMLLFVMDYALFQSFKNALHSKCLNVCQIFPCY